MTDMQRAAARRREELEMFRDWMHSHPHRSDPDVRPAAIDWLNSHIAELDKPQEMKNTLRPGRVRLRARLRSLVTLILTQTTRVE
ncbi:hypothetical protein COHCIP112018_02359 [Cohnella sp. JJ-181]|nr:hypothetical protein COHCIP112018_02359 [Cohnella sp. JJ-181]